MKMVHTFGIIILVISLIPVTCSARRESWKSDFQNLIKTYDLAEQERLISSILKENPNWQDIQTEIESLVFPEVDKTDTLRLEMLKCQDEVERPYVLYIPPEYDPAQKVPLLVYLHGGVSRPEIIDDPMEYARENVFVFLAREKGWMILFPFGQKDATWWDDTGMIMIDSEIRRVKRNYNIDDNRVWMTGFQTQ